MGVPGRMIDKKPLEMVVDHLVGRRAVSPGWAPSRDDKGINPAQFGGGNGRHGGSLSRGQRTSSILDWPRASILVPSTGEEFNTQMA